MKIVQCKECGSNEYDGFLGEPDERIMFGWCKECGQFQAFQASVAHYKTMTHYWPKFSDVMLAYSLGSGASGL